MRHNLSKHNNVLINFLERKTNVLQRNNYNYIYYYYIF